MPRRQSAPCRHPGCPNLSDGLYCEAHRGLYARENAHRRGYGREWRAAVTASCAGIRCARDI